MIRRLLLLFLMAPLSFAQSITIATTADNPPFSSKADAKNHFYGFDLDIMGEICKRIKIECKYKALMLDELYPAVNNQQVDLAIASIIITPDREEDYLFSLPYLASHVQFITNQHSQLDAPEDIKNKRVGIRRGTPYRSLLELLYKNQVQIVEYPYIPDLMDALDKKKVDSVLLDKDSAQYWYSNNSLQYKLIGPPIPFGGGYGILAKLGRDQLMKQINSALLQMESDGTYLKLYTRYFS